jgi:hypothetical protein
MSASRVKEKKNHLHGLGFFLKLAECDGPPRPITLLNLMKINSFKNILKISISRIILFFYIKLSSIVLRSFVIFIYFLLSFVFAQLFFYYHHVITRKIDKKNKIS